ncbi:hypothetical protein D621_07505 [beta proteobacterium AAP51]|nr:hypothetical protein D621_07505 [beta proteobacterium AAP51]
MEDQFLGFNGERQKDLAALQGRLRSLLDIDWPLLGQCKGISEHQGADLRAQCQIVECRPGPRFECLQCFRLFVGRQRPESLRVLEHQIHPVACVQRLPRFICIRRRRCDQVGKRRSGLRCF